MEKNNLVLFIVNSTEPYVKEIFHTKYRGYDVKTGSIPKRISKILDREARRIALTVLELNIFFCGNLKDFRQAAKCTCALYETGEVYAREFFRNSRFSSLGVNNIPLLLYCKNFKETNPSHAQLVKDMALSGGPCVGLTKGPESLVHFKEKFDELAK